MENITSEHQDASVVYWRDMDTAMKLELYRVWENAMEIEPSIRMTPQCLLRLGEFGEIDMFSTMVWHVVRRPGRRGEIVRSGSGGQQEDANQVLRLRQRLAVLQRQSREDYLQRLRVETQLRNPQLIQPKPDPNA